MRTIEEMDDYKSRAFFRYCVTCKLCDGQSAECTCRAKFDHAVAAFEGCIPMDFWSIQPKDVVNNREAFDRTVQPYVESLNKALKRGYGLLFLGDNGVGKTYFISYILTKAIEKGRTVYFTTMPDLDYNIKRGYKDAALEERLNWMLTSDFLAIDELGKERAKSSNKYMDAQVERLLKRRLDDNYPMLLATNMSMDELSDAYGATVASMLAGKFETVQMEPGDHRAIVHDKMVKDMGYER